jgi:hypothetical protein
MESVVPLLGPGGPVFVQREMLSTSFCLVALSSAVMGKITAGVAIEGSSFVLASLG